MADNENAPEEKESEQFNSMLSAAQKHIGVQDGVSLSQAQIEAMLAGDDDEAIDPGETQASEPAGTDTSSDERESSETGGDDESKIAERFKEGISADSQAAADETEKKTKKKKEKKTKVKKEKKPLDKAALSKMLTTAAVIVALVLGYMICLVFFSDVIKTPNEEFSIKAAKAVCSKLAYGSEMYFYKAYVRNSASADECMLYAVTSYNRIVNSEKTDIYHVVIYKDNPNKINVYYTLDTESPEYIKMRDSDDAKQRVQASNLKNYSDEIFAADKEIQINSPAWERIDCTVINKNLAEKTE